MNPADEVPPERQRGPAEEPSDHSLLRRFRRGSQDAATQLYLRYAQRLRALAEAQCSTELAQRVDVEDIVQSVFGSFFRRATQGFYDVPEGEELWKLLLVIALNKIRAKGAFHRAAKRDILRTTTNDALVNELEASQTQEQADYVFLNLVITEALDRLSEQHRTMMELRIQGHEIAEIARITGRSKRSAERILQEARNQLRDLLNKDD